MDYISDIHQANSSKVLLLIDASLQAYNAFDSKHPAVCQQQKITPPAGYDFIDSWLGVDSVFGKDKTIECYGLVFRSQSKPFRYIFAFRGTDSLLDAIDDLGAKKNSFTSFNNAETVPESVKVEAGFFDIYSSNDGKVYSMQQQLFALLDTYQNSDKPIDELYITGHSLGSALSQLFTLDIAVSRPDIKASNINFACPRVGNNHFVDFYEQQPAQQDSQTRTLRVQNTYDKVPCVPFEDMGYQHINNALIIAFYKDSWLGKANWLDCHSANNYSAVLNCAAQSKQGMCINKDLNVPANGYAVTSEKPNAHTIGQL